jgi:hypothetical protein
MAKSPEPCPGSYDVENCYVKLRAAFKGGKISPSKLETYIQYELKKTANVPGVGQYKGLDLAYAKTYKPMRKPRR